MKKKWVCVGMKLIYTYSTKGGLTCARTPLGCVWTSFLYFSFQTPSTAFILLVTFLLPN